MPVLDEIMGNNDDIDEANHYACWVQDQEANHHWGMLPLAFRETVLKQLHDARDCMEELIRVRKELKNEKQLNIITGALLVISIVAQGFYMIQSVTP